MFPIQTVVVADGGAAEILGFAKPTLRLWLAKPQVSRDAAPVALATQAAWLWLFCNPID